MPSQRLKQKPVIQASTVTNQVSKLLPTPIDEKKVMTAAVEETKIDPNASKDDDNGIEETPVGKGIAQALKVFRERGMLGRDMHRGRTKDKTLDEQLNSFSTSSKATTLPAQKQAPELKEVDLQYFDNKGRKLTIKEAYRQMCWKFHGRQPSHNKMAKLNKKEENQVKVQAAHNALNFNSGAGVATRPAVGSALGSLSRIKKK